MVCLCLFVVLPIVAGILYLFAKQDCNLILVLCERFGKQPDALKGQVIWITGASSGIGRELAYELAKAGCKLVLSATRKERLDEARDKCLKLNGRLGINDILVLPIDMTDLKAQEEAHKKVLEHFGKLDMLVNNAARFQMSQFEETDLAVDRALFELNVISVVNLTRLVIKEWIDKKQKGHVAVTSSFAGFAPGPVSSGYVGTKHALHGYFSSIAAEVGNRGITTSIVCPGPVKTELQEKSFVAKINERSNQNVRFAMPIMSAERCGRLFAIALANKLRVAWTINQPFLFVAYLSQYTPTLIGYLLPLTMSADRIRRMANADYS